MRMHISCYIVIFLLHFQGIIANLNRYDNPPEVLTPLGKVQGSWKVSYDGQRYAAFEGIPYAKPPIGNLRFQEPEPNAPWIGIWNATKLYTCIQTSMDVKSDSLGDEDCLYINVFVPKEINDQQILNVVVHIHGGGFMFGSGQEFVEPKYVMDRDIILVTFNYRLGVLGFLSTEDEILPGNNGLKDQVAALKWIQQNIASFGGNPNSVTLTGFSAGGASVHLHYISPLSRGLFHRGMSISGVGIAEWAIEEHPLEYARNLASLVGCPITTSRELVECLKTRPASLLIEKTKNSDPFALIPLSLKPVVENTSKNPFIFEHPYKTLVKKNILDVPWITSATRDELIFFSISFRTMLDELNKRWTEAAPNLLQYQSARQRPDISNKIKDYYFGRGVDITEYNLDKLTKLTTDRIVVGAETAAKLQSQATKSPVYFYYFNYDKGENTFPNLYASDGILSGVSHGDDMVYFFGGLILKNLSESDIKLKNACLDMLYSYATTGVPKFEGVEWLPTSSGEKLTYLNITSSENIKLQDTNDLTSNKLFWEEIDELLKNIDTTGEKYEL